MLIINSFIFAHEHPANFRMLASIQSKISEHYSAGKISCPSMFSPFLVGVVVHMLPGVKQVEHPVLAINNIHIILPMSMVVIVHPRQMQTSFSRDIHKIIS